MQGVRKIVAKVAKGIVVTLFLLILSLPFIFTKIDRTPYRQMDYYQTMMKRIDSVSLDSAAEMPLQAGWAQASILPSYLPHLAGYGIRPMSEAVHDTVYAKAIVLSTALSKSVIISLDLLIFPPSVAAPLLKKLKQMGYQESSVYLSATHTHHAPGGWAGGPGGRFLAGKYKQDYVDFLVEKCIAVVLQAEQNKETAEIGFQRLDLSALVHNRLRVADAGKDGYMRVVKLRKNSGQTAAFVSYSAHANCLLMKYNVVSADYPGALAQKLLATKKINFMLFAAGMVGSHAPDEIPPFKNNELATIYADSLSKPLLASWDSIPMRTSTSIATLSVPLTLREPHLKISQNWRIRPWLFKALLGTYEPKLNMLCLGNIVLLGTPCDFSGELMKDFEPICQEKKINLIVTSFNGGYIGYINADRHYDLPRAETRDMNWFGPYNQAYFTEIVVKLLEKI
jgi:neutral ceramidase